MQRGGGVTLIVYFFVNFKIFELEHIVYMNVEEFLSKSQLPQGLKRGGGGGWSCPQAPFANNSALYINSFIG